MIFNADDIVAERPDWQEMSREQRLAAYPRLQPIAAAQRDIAFEHALARPPRPGEAVHVLAGGQASGKSTLASQLTGLILDTTLARPARAQRIIERIKSTGRDTVVHYVWRSIEDAARANLERAVDTHRAVTAADMARAHAGARDTIEYIIRQYADDPRIGIILYDRASKIMSPRELAAKEKPPIDTLLRRALNIIDEAVDIPEEIRRAARAEDSGGAQGDR